MKTVAFLKTIIVAIAFCITVVPQAVVQAGSAKIEFTYIPLYGSTEDLQGMVSDVNVTNYKVAVCIYVGQGWWTKPYFAWPLTLINPDGTWTCDITTGGYDTYATEIIAFLVPSDYNGPIIADNDPCPPYELYDFPYTVTMRYEKTIQFSEYGWWLKRHSDTVGPGPNYFSDSKDNIWVDANGFLHLKITFRDGKWNCAEVIANLNGGYGTYIFTVKGRVDLLDENIVLGLFTWEDCIPEYDYREIDFEFTRWGDPCDPNNAQFVVLPTGGCNGIYRFNVDCSVQETFTNIFTWAPGMISFRSYYGDFSLMPAAQDMIASWIYTGSDVPPPGQENPRMNLWLRKGLSPVNGQEAEIVIKKFQYLADTAPEIDLVDFAVLADNWLQSNCGICHGADVTADGKVDLDDLSKLVCNWLVLPY
jgi:hypothetical protein